MCAIPLEQPPSGQLPCSEQVKRLKKLGMHLKRFLSRYYCEPQTRDRYLQRESLKEQLRELEEKCNLISQRQGQETSMVSRLTDEIARLTKEFRRLETLVHKYKQEIPS